jgi:hypothetical protein
MNGAYLNGNSIGYSYFQSCNNKPTSNTFNYNTSKFIYHATNYNYSMPNSFSAGGYMKVTLKHGSSSWTFKISD